MKYTMTGGTLLVEMIRLRTSPSKEQRRQLENLKFKKVRKFLHKKSYDEKYNKNLTQISTK